MKPESERVQYGTAKRSKGEVRERRAGKKRSRQAVKREIRLGLCSKGH